MEVIPKRTIDVMCERVGGGRFLGEAVRSHAFAGLEFHETRYSARSSLPRHCHENAYFCLILAGTYQEEYGRRRRSCGPNMLAFHPAEEVHAEYFDKDDVRSFNAEISASWPHAVIAPLNAPFESKDASIVGLALQMFAESKALTRLRSSSSKVSCFSS